MPSNPSRMGKTSLRELWPHHRSCLRKPALCPAWPLRRLPWRSAHVGQQRVARTRPASRSRPPHPPRLRASCLPLPLQTRRVSRLLLTRLACSNADIHATPAQKDITGQAHQSMPSDCSRCNNCTLNSFCPQESQDKDKDCLCLCSLLLCTIKHESYTVGISAVSAPDPSVCAWHNCYSNTQYSSCQERRRFYTRGHFKGASSIPCIYNWQSALIK